MIDGSEATHTKGMGVFGFEVGTKSPSLIDQCPKTLMEKINEKAKIELELGLSPWVTPLKPNDPIQTLTSQLQNTDLKRNSPERHLMI